MVEYSYDTVGNLIALTYPGGRIVRYEYNEINKLVKVTDWNNRITRYEYDKNGRLIKAIRPNGIELTLIYNAAGQVIQRKEVDAKGNIMHRIEIPLKLYKCNNSVKEVTITCEDVQYADISFYEPWGAGIYVAEVSINDGVDIINRLVEYQSNNESFCLSILLNSGDRINILTSKVIYSET